MEKLQKQDDVRLLFLPVNNNKIKNWFFFLHCGFAVGFSDAINSPVCLRLCVKQHWVMISATD